MAPLALAPLLAVLVHLPTALPGSLDGPGSLPGARSPRTAASGAGLRGPGSAASSLGGASSLPGHGRSASRELDHLECRRCGQDLFDFSRDAQPSPPNFGLLRPKGRKDQGSSAKAALV